MPPTTTGQPVTTMTETATDRVRQRRRLTVLALVFLGSYAYFYEGGGWNQNTRFDLVRAIVERHTLRIDAFHDNTGDEAHFGTHFYTDKAPGASLVAVPVVATARLLMRAAGVDVGRDEVVERLAYFATVAAAGVPSVVAAVCVFLVGVRLGSGETAATVGAVVCALGTPLWAYGTLLYGHTLAGGCLILAFLCALETRDATRPSQEITLGFLTGLAGGWAVVTEYPAAIASILIGCLALWYAGLSDRSRTMRVVVPLACGVAVGAVVFMGYNWLAYGKPIYVAYTSEEGYEAMRTGIFGINLPKLSTLRELLFGSYRGLLPLSPVLVVTPVGFWLLARDARTRGPALVALSVIVYYFLMTSGYAYWSGGWSYGSRHLGPALPFLCLGIAPAWQRLGLPMRTAILVLAVFSIGESLVAVSTTPQPPADFNHPMRELLWPAFQSGDFPIGWQSILEKRPAPGPMSELERNGVPRAAWNAGQLAGLRGHASLVPLYLIWIVGGVLWWRTRPKPITAPQPSAAQ